MRELGSRGSQKEKDAKYRITEEGMEVKERLTRCYPTVLTPTSLTRNN